MQPDIAHPCYDQLTAVKTGVATWCNHHIVVSRNLISSITVHTSTLHRAISTELYITLHSRT